MALSIVSAILGVINVLQWIIGYVSGNSLRAKAQASYNDTSIHDYGAFAGVHLQAGGRT